LEFWSEGKINILDNADGSDGMFAIAHMGVDRLVTDKLLLGGKFSLIGLIKRHP
jgi:hypothetical protein